MASFKLLTEYYDCAIDATLQVKALEVDSNVNQEYTQYGLYFRIEENKRCGIYHPITVTL